MKIANGNKLFYQWEYDQQLIVPEGCAQVLFENGTTENALACAVRQDGDRYVCDVPNVFLQTAAKIQAYGWNGNTVVAAASFTVVPRAKPDNYIYNQTDVLGVERAVQEALEELKSTGQLPKGDKGDKGDDGYSPIRGLDYWTEEDKTEIINETKTGAIGDIETALDTIIAIQEELMGGGDTIEFTCENCGETLTIEGIPGSVMCEGCGTSYGRCLDCGTPAAIDDPMDCPNCGIPVSCPTCGAYDATITQSGYGGPRYWTCNECGYEHEY